MKQRETEQAAGKARSDEAAAHLSGAAGAIEAAGLGSGVLTINLAALQHNYRALQAAAAGAAKAGAARGASGAAKAGGAQVAGVVKADAYGLGADIIAPALYEAGCRLFFVAQLAEALALRAVLVGRRGVEIAILNDVLPAEAPAAAAAGLIPVLDSLDSLRLWAAEAARLGRKLPAMLQADSGMSRLGLDAAELAQLFAAPQLLKHIEIKAFLSHLACADTAASPMNEAQRARFLAVAGQLQKCLGRRVPLSLAASCGAALGHDYCFDIIRPGIALYGIVDGACDHQQAKEKGAAAKPACSRLPGKKGGAAAATEADSLAAVLRPVVSLTGRVLRLGQMQAGETCGYGATYRAAAPLPTATISAGYADGWPRSLSNKGSLYYQGVRLPIIGRISMDCLVVSLAPLAAAGLALPPRGALIEFIGPHQSLSQVAADAGMIPYEILTSLGRRWQRRLIR